MPIFNYTFTYVEDIIPETRNGKIITYTPQSQYNNIKGFKLNAFGNGEFCKFTMTKIPSCSGVYAWVVDGKVLYIGEAKDIKKRFNTGYGNISPRNCFEKGQPTNCKMNKFAMDCYNEGTPVQIYIFETNDYKNVEHDILKKYKEMGYLLINIKR